MPYDNTIPKATDALDDSQLDLLNNFIAIQQLVGVNHVNFNVPDQGKHTQVTLPNNVAPTPTLANEMSIFSRNSAFSTLFGAGSALFWQADGTGSTIDMTSAGIQPGPPRTGFTRLSSGLLVKFGLTPSLNGISQIYTYPVSATIPAFANIIPIVLVSPFVLAANRRVVNISLSSLASFTVSIVNMDDNPAASELFYVAIGV